MNLENLVVPFELDSKKFTSGLSDVQKQLAGIGGAIALGGIAAVGTAMGVATAKTIDWAGKMDSLQDILGGTNKEAAGMNLMVERVGGSTEQVTGAIKKMAMGLYGANGELGKSGTALKDLGISLTDTNGSMKDSYQIFGEVSDKISKMPDGIEKDTTLMTIFGKSGAELGDILNAAADGGMANFQSEAESMGLAIDPSKAIEFEKAQKKLDDTFTGLSVTLGTAILPIITTVATKFQEWLSNPDIQNGIKGIADKISDLAAGAISHIPDVIKQFENISKWFKDNPGVVIGLLAAMGVAVVAFGVSVAVAAATAIAPLLPVIAIMAGVGVAAYLLYQAWTTNFGGIRDKVTEAWNVIKPLFETMETWLKVNVPLALQWLSDSWDNFQNTLHTVIDQIVSMVNTAITAVNNLITAFGNLTGLKIPTISTVAYTPASSMGRSGIPGNKSNSDIFGANGIDNFKVPSGYNENFQVGVSSGEYVNVSNNPLGGNDELEELRQIKMLLSKLDIRDFATLINSLYQQGA